MTLPEMSFTGAVLIAAVLILRALLFRRLPKRTFSALWGVAILRLLLPFSVASAFSVYALFPAISAPVSVPTADAPFNAFGTGAPDGTADASAFSAAIGAPPEGDSFPVADDTAEGEPIPAPVSAETVLFSIWSGGAVLPAGGFLFVYLRERRKFLGAIPLQNGFIEAWRGARPLKRRLVVAVSDRVAVPLTYGVLRPVILLPDSFDLSDEKRLGYVLEHELIHIRRFDALKKPLCALALCVHWFNPLVWVLFFCYERDLELACDEAVVWRLGEEKRSDYARTLIGMEAERSGFRPFYSRFGGSAVEERIKAIMKIKKKSFTAGAAAFLVVFATAGAFTTSALGQERKPEGFASEDGTSEETAFEKEWWTAEEFEEWIAAEKSEMEALIGTGSGWYDGEGTFHLFTKESMEEALAQYEEVLAEIRSGVLYSKDMSDGVQISMLPPEDREAEKAAYAEMAEELERRLRPYQAFGVSVRKGEGEPEIVYYEEDGVRPDAYGEPETVYRKRTVRALFDEKTGDYFTTHTGLWSYGEDAVDLYAVYEGGVLTGVREATAEEYAEADRLRRESSEKAAEIEKRPEERETAVYRDSVTVGNGGETTVCASDRTALSSPIERAEALDERILFAEYRLFGLEQGADGTLTWNGKPVRWFVDGTALDGEGAFATRYTYYNEKGSVDLHTVWEKKENGDGSYDPFGKLAAIEEYKDFNPAFLARDGEIEAVTVMEKDVFESAGLPFLLEATATAEGNSAEGGGRTFAEIFAEYASFGIVYDEAEGNVYLNERLVGTFVDLTDTGVFSYHSRNAAGRPTIDVRTCYRSGELVAIREMTDAERNAPLTEE